MKTTEKEDHMEYSDQCPYSIEYNSNNIIMYVCHILRFLIMAGIRRYGDLNLSQTVVFVCDIQERFRKAIKYFDQIAEVANRLVRFPLLLSC